jgi:hypothetical protein
MSTCNDGGPADEDQGLMSESGTCKLCGATFPRNRRGRRRRYCSPACAVRGNYVLFREKRLAWQKAYDTKRREARQSQAS